MRHATIIVSCLALFLLPGCNDSRESARGFKLPRGDSESGRAVFVQMDCQNCHSIRGEPESMQAGVATLKLGGSTIDPPTDGYLVSAIIHPSHVIKRQAGVESTLPSGASRMVDCNETLTVQELIDLVAYLQSIYQLDTSYEGHGMP